MLKISGATRSKKDYQRANIQSTRYYNHNLLLHGQQRLKISRGLPAAFHRRRAYLRLQMQASATHASSPTMSVSVSVCGVCVSVYFSYYRLVQASVTYAVLGVCAISRCYTYNISVIHIVFSRKSLCMLCMIEYIACWVYVVEYVK